MNRINTFDGRTALHYAAERNNIPMLTLLLDHSADKTVADCYGLTPSQIAQSLHFDKVETLR